MRMRVVQIVCALCAVACMAVAGDFAVAERGAGVCAVEVSAKWESAGYAADELRKYAGAITGEKSVAQTRKAVIEAGDESLGDDGFEIFVEDGVLHVRGGKRGVIYGVYEILERFGGCMWLSSWSEYVPKATRLAVPEFLGTRIFGDRPRETLVNWAFARFEGLAGTAKPF